MIAKIQSMSPLNDTEQAHTCTSFGLFCFTLLSVSFAASNLTIRISKFALFQFIAINGIFLNN